MSLPYRSPVSGLTNPVWGNAVSAAMRASAVDFMSMKTSVFGSATRALVEGSTPIWMDTVRQVASRASWIDQVPSFSTAAMMQSYRRELLAAANSRKYDVLSAITTPGMNSSIASTVRHSGILNPSTTVVSSLVKELDLGWKPLHLAVPGLTGGPVPGFDATVRSILADVSERLGTDLEVPDEEIEFTAWPDIELQSDPEYIDYTNGLGHELQSAFWPRQQLMQAARNIIFIILVYALAHDAAADIVESLPAQVTEQLPEDVMPDEIQPPDWLWKTILLGYGIHTARKDTSDPDR